MQTATHDSTTAANGWIACLPYKSVATASPGAGDLQSLVTRARAPSRTAAWPRLAGRRSSRSAGACSPMPQPVPHQSGPIMPAKALPVRQSRLRNWFGKTASASLKSPATVGRGCIRAINPHLQSCYRP